jgi:hypothetical protein
MIMETTERSIVVARVWHGEQQYEKSQHNIGTSKRRLHSSTDVAADSTSKLAGKGPQAPLRCVYRYFLTTNIRDRCGTCLSKKDLFHRRRIRAKPLQQLTARLRGSDVLSLSTYHVPLMAMGLFLSTVNESDVQEPRAVAGP